MSSRPETADFLTLLLDELEARVMAHATLAVDLAAQLGRFPAAAGDLHAALRFREWYLLEHAPEALGAPPALCWAPDAPEPTGPWGQLLAARFGIMRFRPEVDDAAVEELWTGRRSALAAKLDGADEQTLMIGWFTPVADGLELPLPGARVLAVPGLRDALEKDLAQARIENPRGRLSQWACEQMLVAIADAAGDPNPSDDRAETLEAELVALLESAPGWNLSRVLQVIEDGGDQELMERLAFETDVDLEQLRRILLEWREAARASEARGGGEDSDLQSFRGSVDQTDAATVAAALETFDASAGETPLEERFAALEATLGLAEGATSEGAPLDDDAEPLGPSEIPGLPFWIASWAWEVEHHGEAPTESELRTLAAFSDFVGASRDAQLDAQDLARTDLTSFLMASADVPQLEERRRATARSLRWLETEQQAATDGLSEELDGELGLRLQAAVAANAELASGAVRGDASARLSATDPPTVESEDGQQVPAHGLPEIAAQHCEPGDRLLGHWADGRFQVAAWMPQALLATRQD